MKHDDALSNSLFDSLNQGTESEALESDKAHKLAIDRANVVSALAPVKRFEPRQSVSENSENATVPIVDSFLPAPNRWLIIGGLGLAGVLGLSAIFLTSLPHRTIVKAKVKVEPVAEPRVLQSGAGGTVASIRVQNYDSLKPNQVIASFENPDLYSQLSELQARISQTQQQLKQLNDELIAIEERQASGRWLAFKVPQGQFEYSKRLLLDNQNELQQRLTVQQQQLANVQEQIDNTTIYTPLAGTVYDLEIKNVGQTVAAGEPIAKIISKDIPLEIKALVSDSDVNIIKVGSPTQINLASCAYSNFGILEGEVADIQALTPELAEGFTAEDGLSPNFDQHMVTIVAKPDNSRQQTCKVLPGVNGEVNIIARQERFLNFVLRKLRFSSNV
ncbi:MAG: HlyD family efflux transporter periplasmic adaptor subunit [Cyanobacteria bacterium P01_D01_bin.156]